MAEKPVNAKVQQRNDTAENWLLQNPVLLQGEIGVENDTGKVKIGDGSSPWAALPYFGGGSLTLKEIFDAIYPVGIVITTITKTSPNTYMPFGTWQDLNSNLDIISLEDKEGEAAKVQPTAAITATYQWKRVI